jgi:hypothetical protein
MKTLLTIEQQIKIWNRLAIVVPVLSTTVLSLLYITGTTTILNLFYIACLSYFFTAIIWWWWTMKNIAFLIKILQSTRDNLSTVAEELRAIRKEIV